DKGSFNIGIRLVRNAVPGFGSVEGALMQAGDGGAGNSILIAYFSWGGNTRGIAEEIQSQTGADLFEITLVNPYSSDYNTVLDEAQRDQNEQARPELASHVENMDDYDTIILGYPNWWASIPMPIASFLEEYDFSGKTIIPFCSHGGGRFGQSLTAMAKLAPDSDMGEGLSVHYSGGSYLGSDVSGWLETNGIETKDKFLSFSSFFRSREQFIFDVSQGSSLTLFMLCSVKSPLFVLSIYCGLFLLSCISEVIISFSSFILIFCFSF
ncbi:MAG: NAD(P)H-dependent oxidoreductase, partial [Clostridia bacterium]|nr:NAD(P)H-dependent oxidoreductase [Clostridia bacterium]